MIFGSLLERSWLRPEFWRSDWYSGSKCWPSSGQLKARAADKGQTSSPAPCGKGWASGYRWNQRTKCVDFKSVTGFWGFSSRPSGLGSAGCTWTRHLRYSCGLLALCYCNERTGAKVLGEASNPVWGRHKCHISQMLKGNGFSLTLGRSEWVTN